MGDKMGKTEEGIVINPEKKGVVYENYIEYDQSIFKKVYDKAKVLTEQIVNENVSYRNTETHGNNFRNKEQFNNVISFIGRRGTGKTSAMLSFMEGLKDHHKEHRVIQDEKKRLEFIGLEWIDASLLEETEDIFDMILAKMFAELLRMNREVYGNKKRELDYEYRELYQQFEKIYKCNQSIKKRDVVLEDEMAITALHELARSTQMREDFAELVRMYINYCNDMRPFGDRYRRDAYLVIAIDDIDLNLKKGYNILEQIHRYLMVPGLIVLVAINYGEMLALCEKRYVQFYNLLGNIGSVNLKKQAAKISEDYLEKVLPAHMRVYLPSLKKTDYDVHDNRKIKIDGKEMCIKQAVFFLIYKKTGVFYDARGLKRHFWEPETLRGLSSLYSLYSQMEDLKSKEDDEYLDIYNANYCKVLDDLLFRFAYDYLPYREREMFTLLCEENIVRRGEELISIIINELSSYGQKHTLEAFITNFGEDYKNYGYSYGEILRSLYCMSKSQIYDKHLVHVMLAEYTVVYSRIYKLFCINEYKSVFEEKDKKIQTSGEERSADDENDNCTNYRSLKVLLGKSFGGSWGKYILSTPGAGSLPEKRIIESIVIGSKEFSGKMNWETCKKFLLSTEIEGNLVALLAIGMTVFEENTEESFIKVTPEVVEGSTKKLALKLTNCIIYISPFNFMNNSFDFEEVFNFFYRSMCKALYKEYLDIEDIKKVLEIDNASNETVTIERMVEKLLSERESFYGKYKEWHKKYFGLAFPIYNFDITYNLLKRLLRDRKGFLYDNGNEYYGKLKELYAEIKNKLEEQDEFYKAIDKGIESGFYTAFKECPVIDKILSDEKNIYKDAFCRLCGVKETPDPQKDPESKR